MSFKDGDFIRIEYSAWRVADNKLVYTTDEKKAKDNGVYFETSKYGPQLVVVGKSQIIKGLDAAIKGMSLNESKKVELSPEQAFGAREQDLVKVMSLSDFRSRNMDPYPGMQVDLDGVIATVKSVNSGRVLVDANHPLAGEKLTYEVKVIAKIDKEEEKVSALAESYSLKPVSVKIEGKSVNLEFDGKTEKNSDYFINKTTFVDALLRYMDNLEKVYVKEEYTREKKEETHDHDHKHE